MSDYIPKVFETHGRRYFLRDPISLTRRHVAEDCISQPFIVLENDEYEIDGFSLLEEYAFDEVLSDFDFVYREIAEEKDENLTPKVIELKNKYLDIVERIETIAHL